MRLKWLSLVHQQGCETTVKSAHFLKMAISINAVIHSVSAAGAFGRVQVLPLKLDTCCSLGFSLQMLMFK